MRPQTGEGREIVSATVGPNLNTIKHHVLWVKRPAIGSKVIQDCVYAYRRCVSTFQR
jgi:hypothetical protein